MAHPRDDFRESLTVGMEKCKNALQISGGCAGLELIEPLSLGRPCCYVNCLLNPAYVPALVSINSFPETALARPNCVDNKIIPRTLDFNEQK